MMRFVLSTIGTSILTNLINPEENNWRGMLRESANLKPENLDTDVQTALNTLAERALQKLCKNDIRTNRQISAELNGIYGIYNGKLPEDSPDEHYLICSDTAQGQKTGELIQVFLSQYFHKNEEPNVKIVTPNQLSTKDTESFTIGIKELIQWLQDNVAWRRDNGYRVIFNLVGGFKSLQGYMNTFGAFYADEIVYIFEAETDDLIRIPRLPLQIDTTVIQEYRKEFASMVDGTLYPRRELSNIPETLLEFLEEENDSIQTGLSAWGVLLWNQAKEDLLTSDALTIQGMSKSVQTKLALMEAGKRYPQDNISDIPNVLLDEFVEKNGTTCAQLSAWGKLVWDQTKQDLLIESLLPFPRLQYLRTFISDFDGADQGQRCDLQKTLAKVARMLDENNGDTTQISDDHGLNFEQLKKDRSIYTLRVNQGSRVSCGKGEGGLILRHYGTHDYVDRNP
jgi:putative CRISPR-associated protein (TIGR02619 family)